MASPIAAGCTVDCHSKQEPAKARNSILLPAHGTHDCNNRQRNELRIKCTASTPWLMLHAACRRHQLKPAAGKYTTADGTAKIRDLSPFGHETRCTDRFRRDEAHYLATVRRTIRLSKKRDPWKCRTTQHCKYMTIPARKREKKAPDPNSPAESRRAYAEAQFTGSGFKFKV